MLNKMGVKNGLTSHRAIREYQSKNNFTRERVMTTARNRMKSNVAMGGTLLAQT